MRRHWDLYASAIIEDEAFVHALEDSHSEAARIERTRHGFVAQVISSHTQTGHDKRRHGVAVARRIKNFVVEEGMNAAFQRHRREPWPGQRDGVFLIAVVQLTTPISVLKEVETDSVNGVVLIGESKIYRWR